MPNLLIRDVPEQVVEALKRRAAHHRRSLQQELLQILEQSAEVTSVASAADVAAAIRERLAQRGISLGDSTPLIRADRER